MTSNFRTRGLGELAQLFDSLHRTPHYVERGYPMIRVTDIRRGFVETKDAVRVDEETYSNFSKKHKPTLGDILFSRVGSYGNSAYVKRNEEFCLGQNTVCISPDRSEIEPYFLYCSLNSDDVRHQIESLVGGSSQGTISLSNIKLLQIPVPSLRTQLRIAGILSAYDELIENTQRRIRILEGLARTLYREWFVHCHFPGHEKIPRVSSPLGNIPHGWLAKTVAESFEVCGGGTPSRKEPSYWENGTVQWFAPSDLTAAATMFMDDSVEHITELGLTNSSARLFPAFSVMMTSRATIGAIAINTREACTNQGFIICLPNERVPLYFLFHWLIENVTQFERLASGATFKEISRGVFKTIHFLNPSASLVGRFESQVRPIAGQILVLQRQIQNLRHTRDLLLPRLMSGQIDVSCLGDDVLTSNQGYATVSAS